jgi:hypothetical protein
MMSRSRRTRRQHGHHVRQHLTVHKTADAYEPTTTQHDLDRRSALPVGILRHAHRHVFSRA